MSLVEAQPKAKVDCRKKKFIFLGCGSVAKCAIYFLQEFLEVDYNLVHIVDEIDMKNVPALQEIFKKGANFYKLRLEDDDYERLFKLFKVSPYDVVIDLTTNVNVFKIIEAVRKNSLLYLNTSMEINWHFNANSSIYDESLFKRHILAEEVAKNVKDPNNATHCYEFGMNPGLISHFTFKAIIDVAKMVLKEKEDKELQEYVDKKEYAKMAKYLGVELVHCSEIDTQIGKNVKDENTFVNTWSCIGLLEEGLEPVQLGWGTHEKEVPKNAEVMDKYLIGLKTPAYQKMHRSYVPDEEIVGTVIPHGEGVTLTQALSLPDYSPTVHYVYKLCPQTRALLAKMPFEELKRLKEWRVMDPLTDQLEGEDRIGCLLVLNKNPITGEKKNWSYWCGSILGQELSKFFGPTVIQVAAGVLTATRWMIENPSKGPVYSEALPTDWVLDVAKPFLGVVLSKPVPWSPASTQFSDLEVQP
jgi:homospermidine synthase